MQAAKNKFDFDGYITYVSTLVSEIKKRARNSARRKSKITPQLDILGTCNSKTKYEIQP